MNQPTYEVHIAVLAIITLRRCSQGHPRIATPIASTRLALPDPVIQTGYDRDAEMRACVHRHGGMQIVRWEHGHWQSVYAPWRKVKAIEYSHEWPQGRGIRKAVRKAVRKEN